MTVAARVQVNAAFLHWGTRMVRRPINLRQRVNQRSRDAANRDAAVANTPLGYGQRGLSRGGEWPKIVGQWRVDLTRHYVCQGGGALGCVPGPSTGRNGQGSYGAAWAGRDTVNWSVVISC